MPWPPSYEAPQPRQCQSQRSATAVTRSQPMQSRFGSAWCYHSRSAATTKAAPQQRRGCSPSIPKAVAWSQPRQCKRANPVIAKGVPTRSPLQLPVCCQEAVPGAASLECTAAAPAVYIQATMPNAGTDGDRLSWHLAVLECTANAPPFQRRAGRWGAPPFAAETMNRKDSSMSASNALLEAT